MKNTRKSIPGRRARLRSRGRLVPAAAAVSAALGLMAQGRSVAQDGIPVARIRQSVICCPSDTVRLDGWASIDPGGDVAVWLWDIDGDGEADTMCPSGEVTLTAPETSGPRKIHLWVKDNEGNLSAPDTAVLHVMNSAPVVKMPSDTTIKIGVRLPFNAAAYAACGAIAKYEWDFNNDGTFEYRSRENARTTRVFYKQGKFTARFRAVDTFGNEAGGIRTVTVTGEFAE
jgi:hypothetical protein